jgi:cytochrome c556
VIRYFAIFLIVGAALAQAPSTPATTAESAGLKSIGTMKEIMVDLIFPTSNEIFYVGRNENKSPKDWMDLQQNALIIAEAANLLMAENRARDKDRWMRDAKLLQDVGAKAYKMAKAKDLEGLKGLNDEMYEACQSCHEHYRPGYRRRL